MNAQGTAQYELAEEIIGRLLDLFHAMQQDFEAHAAALGLTPAEAGALHRLDRPEPMRVMADALHCDASYVTLLTDQLAARGLVERTPDEQDRRVKRLVLTPAGRLLRADLVGRIHASSPALAGLDPEQRGSLAALLRAIGLRGDLLGCQ